MKNYTDLKTFEQACKVENLDPLRVIPDVSAYLAKDRVSMIAHAKILTIVRAANRLANQGEEWVPDFSSWEQPKYTPWFEYDKGSSGFRCGGCGAWYACSTVGSRLCFSSRDVAKYIGEQFIDLYNEYLN